MSTTVRRLPDGEYDRLQEIAEGFTPTPEGSVVVVAEDEEGEICGRLMLLPLLHLDAVWIRGDKRRATTLARLEKKMVQVLTDAEISAIFVNVALKEMEGYLTRWGYKKMDVISVFSKELQNGN